MLLNPKQEDSPSKQHDPKPDSVPKTLSPRIKRDNSRELTTETRIRREEFTPTKILINQRSSDTNFHEKIDVSEE